MSLNTTLCEGKMFGYFCHSVNIISSGQAQSEPIKRHPLYSQTQIKRLPLGRQARTPAIRERATLCYNFILGFYSRSRESGESCIFPKMALLASSPTCQKRQIFGEYSNSTNSPANGHCLVFPLALFLSLCPKWLDKPDHFAANCTTEEYKKLTEEF